MSKISSITVNVDFETIRSFTDMTTEEIEGNEGNIDFALFQAFRREFSEAEEVKASCGYVSSVVVEAYDNDNNPVSVSGARVDSAIRTALDNL